jgi:hypothetical protein
VFGRAGIQRTVFVVALLVTSGAAGAFAREFRAVDTRNEDYPIVQALRFIGRMADLEGLRLRVQQSEQMSGMIRALGAGPVELPYGQVLTDLATKLIDGAESNWPSFVTAADHYKHAGHDTLTEHTMSPEVLVMAAMVDIHAKAQRNPAAAQLIERIRKVE